MTDMKVSLPVGDAGNLIHQAVTGGSITGEMIDSYQVMSPAGTVWVLVYEKHYVRAGNRLTLTVTLDDFESMTFADGVARRVTRIHCAGGGGGQGLFRFDWGASESFEDTVLNALRPYRVG